AMPVFTRVSRNIDTLEATRVSDLPVRLHGAGRPRYWSVRYFLGFIFERCSRAICRARSRLSYFGVPGARRGNLLALPLEGLTIHTHCRGPRRQLYREDRRKSKTQLPL